MAVDEYRTRLQASARSAILQPQLQDLRLRMPAFAAPNCTTPSLLGRCEILLLLRLDLIATRSKIIKGVGGFLVTMEVSALKILERLRVKVGLTR